MTESEYTIKIKKLRILSDIQIKKLKKYSSGYLSSDIYINSNCIAFDNKETHNKWLYFAGFEYIQKQKVYENLNNFLIVYKVDQQDEFDKVFEYLTLFNS
jgi:hypothetical protein